MADLQWSTEKRIVNDLVPYEYNPRFLSDRQKEDLMKSLQRFNLVEIPAINLDNKLIAGHQRCKLLQLLGRGEEVIYVRVPNRMLTDKEYKEYNVRSNANTGSWDLDILDTHFHDIDLNEIGLDVSSIQLPDVEVKVLEEDEEALPRVSTKTPLVIVGDIFEFRAGKLLHRIICGDSTNADVVEKLLEGNKPILMVTDPPYGVNYDPSWRADAGLSKLDNLATGKVKNDDIADWAATYVLFESDVAYVWHGALHSHIVAQNLIDAGYILKSQIIWNKPSIVLSRGDYHWKHEPCWYAVKKGKKHNWKGDRKQSTVWDLAGTNPIGRSKDEADLKTDHGTQKPLLAMQKPIENNTEKYDLIVDPFLGSGTTLIAAQKTSRNCRGTELGENYIELIIRRYAKFMADNNEPFEFKHLNGSLSLQQILENV